MPPSPEQLKTDNRELETDCSSTPVSLAETSFAKARFDAEPGLR